MARDIASQGITAHQSRLLRTIPPLLKQGLIIELSFVALVAALVGIVLEWIGEEGTPFLSIIGDVLIMGAFIIAITAFSFFP
jgi:hypothetical protein